MAAIPRRHISASIEPCVRQAGPFLMASEPPGFFQGTGMPDPGWWEALWPEPAKVLADVGVKPATELRMTPEATIAAVEPGGFKFREIVKVSPYHYGAVFARLE